MIREEMISKLHTVHFAYIDPPADWEDIGFSERPLWVNSKGYGYLACDDPSDIYWTGVGVQCDRWTIIRNKLNERSLTFVDISGTSLEELIQEIVWEDLNDEDNITDYLVGLLDLPEEKVDTIYAMNSVEGWIFYSTEDAFKKAYERDWCDYKWEELDDRMLTCWIKRLFTHN